MLMRLNMPAREEGNKANRANRCLERSQITLPSHRAQCDLLLFERHLTAQISRVRTNVREASGFYKISAIV